MSNAQSESERRQATVLFADISGFTSMSEKLDPEEVTAIMDECFALIGGVVAEQGGVIDKFIGDCVMALFGAPKALEGAPGKAIAAAIKMRVGLEVFNKERKLAIPLGIHIGINSGEVLSGMVGSAEKRDFTVMGDAVNLASRLKDLAKQGQILVGPLTWRHAREAFRFIPLKPVSVKGKAEPVQVYEVAGSQKCAEPGGRERMIQSVLVGRDEELKRLELQVMKLVNGQGSVVNLIGEAGIGKSRLCAELYAKDFMKWVRVLEGRALAVGQTLSWYPIIGILKSWASISEEDAEGKAFIKLESAIRAVIPEEADEIVPFIATLMGYRLRGAYADRLEGVKGESLAKIIIKQLKDLVVKAASFKPILFVLEDLHWADESTLDLLRSIVSLADTHPVAFLCAWRPGYAETTEKLHGFLAEKLPDRFVDIGLSALEEEHSGELARNLLRSAGIPERLIERITEKAGGNPFFIEEVIRSFIDRGVMAIDKDGLRISTDIEAIDIPDSIDAVIMSRVDRLDEGTKELLRIASVIGRSFFYRILSQVSGGGEELGGCIEGLKAMQLIQEHVQCGEIEYLFKHILVQETVYRSILVRSRKLLHIKVARAIEEAFWDRLPEFYGVLAFHYSQGEDLDKAEEYLEKAGTAALESAASSEALRCFQAALAIYSEKKGKAASAEHLSSLERKIGKAYNNRLHCAEAVKHYDAALAHLGIRRLGKFGKLTSALSGYFSLLRYFYLPFTRSRRKPSEKETDIIGILIERVSAMLLFDAAEAWLSCFNVVQRVQASEMRSSAGIRMLLDLADMLFGGGFFIRIAGKILEETEPLLLDDLDRYSFKETELWCSTFSGMRDCAYDDSLVDFFLKCGYYFKLTNYIAYWGSRFVYTGRLAEARRAADRARGIASEYGNDAFEQTQRQISGLVHTVEKDSRAALEDAEALIRRGNEIGQSMLRRHYLSHRLNALLVSGNLREAEPTAMEMRDILEKTRILFASANMATILSLADYYSRRAESETERAGRAKLLADASPIRRRLMRLAPKYAYRYPEACKLSGRLLWLAGRQGCALREWQRGLDFGERLGLKLELSRTAFEVAKRLTSPESRHKTLGKLGPEHYAKQARELFTEIGLEVDLRELDEWEQATRTRTTFAGAET